MGLSIEQLLYQWEKMVLISDELSHGLDGHLHYLAPTFFKATVHLKKGVREHH